LAKRGNQLFIKRGKKMVELLGKTIIDDQMDDDYFCSFEKTILIDFQ
jgi:hypothetical protein